MTDRHDNDSPDAGSPAASSPEERLGQAWRRDVEFSIPEMWQERVMSDIRTRGLVSAGAPGHAVPAQVLVERTLWRGALAAAAMVVVALSVALAMGADPVEDLYRLASLRAGSFLELVIPR